MALNSVITIIVLTFSVHHLICLDMSISNRLDPNTTNKQTRTKNEIQTNLIILNSGKEKQDPLLPKSQIPNMLQISPLFFYKTIITFLFHNKSFFGYLFHLKLNELSYVYFHLLIQYFNIYSTQLLRKITSQGYLL